MKVIVEEYGKLLLYILIGSALIVTVVIGIGSWYCTSFSFLGQTSVNTSKTIVDTMPVLLVEPIEIRQKQTNEVIDFTQYAQAYQDSTCVEKITPEVYGAANVELNKKGLYEIIFKVKNRNNESFVKKVPVLVY